MCSIHCLDQSCLSCRTHFGVGIVNLTTLFCRPFYYGIFNIMQQELVWHRPMPQPPTQPHVCTFVCKVVSVEGSGIMNEPILCTHICTRLNMLTYPWPMGRCHVNCAYANIDYQVLIFIDLKQFFKHHTEEDASSFMLATLYLASENCLCNPHFACITCLTITLIIEVGVLSAILRILA